MDQEKQLASFVAHEEVVLWFEFDLFCQTNLLYLLDWFAQQERANTKLSLICIGEFPGKPNFRGLGELNAEELASLSPQRQPVTEAQLQLAQSAWRSYCSPNPAAIEKLLQMNTSDLPYLSPALRGHLRRFPSAGNGLGSVENKCLELISTGATTFLDLFPRFSDAEPIYGLGDAQVWLAIKLMSGGNSPLLTIESGTNAVSHTTPEIDGKARFEISSAGQSVLVGKSDSVQLNGIDHWLGGVHLTEDSVWRWNENSQSLHLNKRQQS
jgi:hypothetical protein